MKEVHIIRRRRYEKGLTQIELAALLGISLVWVSRIERGIETPSIKLAKRIAGILDFDWKLLY